MKHSDALSKDARALLRAARGGDDISAAERQRVLQTFRERVARDGAAADAVASAPRPRAARVSRSARRRPLPRPVKRAAWALAAVIASGSLAAFAHEGAFAGWRDTIARLLSTVAGESASEGAKPAVKDRAARGAPPGSAPTSVAEHELARAADEPAPAASAEPRNAEHAEAERVEAERVEAERTEGEGTGAARIVADDSASGDRETASGDVSSSARIKRTRTHTSSAPRSEPARTPTSEPSGSPTRSQSPSTSTSTSAELDLIITARNALGEKRHADARAAAERHALQFPAGTFGEERDAILALCACRESGASERARTFIEHRPESLFAERIRRDCKLASNSVPGTPPAGTHQESPPRSGTR